MNLMTAVLLSVCCDAMPISSERQVKHADEKGGRVSALRKRLHSRM